MLFRSNTHGVVSTENIGTITSTGNNVGGIVGHSADNTAHTAQVKLSNNSGPVTATGSNVGGIVGNNEGEIISCINNTQGTVTGNTSVGGIAGYNNKITAIIYSGDLREKVKASRDIIVTKNQADVIGKEKVGGIVGTNQGGGILGAYNTGTVLAPQNNKPIMGGIVGNAFYDNRIRGSVVNAFNLGNVNGDGNGNFYPYVGGISGQRDKVATVTDENDRKLVTSIKDSYYLASRINAVHKLAVGNENALTDGQTNSAIYGDYDQPIEAENDRTLTTDFLNDFLKANEWMQIGPFTPEDLIPEEGFGQITRWDELLAIIEEMIKQYRYKLDYGENITSSSVEDYTYNFTWTSIQGYVGGYKAHFIELDEEGNPKVVVDEEGKITLDANGNPIVLDGAYYDSQVKSQDELTNRFDQSLNFTFSRALVGKTIGVAIQALGIDEVSDSSDVEIVHRRKILPPLPTPVLDIPINMEDGGTTYTVSVAQGGLEDLLNANSFDPSCVGTQLVYLKGSESTSEWPSEAHLPTIEYPSIIDWGLTAISGMNPIGGVSLQDIANYYKYYANGLSLFRGERYSFTDLSAYENNRIPGESTAWTIEDDDLGQFTTKLEYGDVLVGTDNPRPYQGLRLQARSVDDQDGYAHSGWSERIKFIAKVKLAKPIELQAIYTGDTQKPSFELSFEGHSVERWQKYKLEILHGEEILLEELMEGKGYTFNFTDIPEQYWGETLAFRVTALGDGMGYEDSDVSDTLEFIVPYRLATPAYVYAERRPEIGDAQFAVDLSIRYQRS